MDELIAAIRRIADETGADEFVTINRNQFRDITGSATVYVLCKNDDLPPEAGSALCIFAAEVNALAWRLLTGEIKKEDLNIETL